MFWFDVGQIKINGFAFPLIKNIDEYHIETQKTSKWCQKMTIKREMSKWEDDCTTSEVINQLLDWSVLKLVLKMIDNCIHNLVAFLHTVLRLPSHWDCVNRCT